MPKAQNLSLFKQCNKCLQEKPYLDYALAKATKDGRSYYCRACLKQEIQRCYNANKEKYKTRVRKWQQENKNRFIQGQKTRNRTSIYRIYHNLSPISRCSIKELKIHLSQLFTQDMTWENYGTVWEVRHVHPKDFFTNPNDYNHYTNLAPTPRKAMSSMQAN